jgi:hypothetical protein
MLQNVSLSECHPQTFPGQNVSETFFNLEEWLHLPEATTVGSSLTILIIIFFIVIRKSQLLVKYHTERFVERFYLASKN